MLLFEPIDNVQLLLQQCTSGLVLVPSPLTFFVHIDVALKHAQRFGRTLVNWHTRPETLGEQTRGRTLDARCRAIGSIVPPISLLTSIAFVDFHFVTMINRGLVRGQYSLFFVRFFNFTNVPIANDASSQELFGFQFHAVRQQNVDHGNFQIGKKDGVDAIGTRGAFAAGHESRRSGDQRPLFLSAAIKQNEIAVFGAFLFLLFRFQNRVNAHDAQPAAQLV
mmetsp:Transcript_18637/g.50971  ORF Transcript_18637/g.50971 Transcript_18637/m.50971 type:complete len:222 (-) Transcript_18637:493-1158(-)